MIFTNRQKEVLVGDGAVLYLPVGESIQNQRVNRKFCYVASGYDENGANRLLDFRSRIIEVAIYPEPERFFVPDTFNKTTNQQEILRKQDIENLKERLGLENITIIRPEATEVVDIMFQHFDATGICLLGKDFIDEYKGYWRYIKTSTPTSRDGSHLARVGYFHASDGPSIEGWLRGKRSVSLGLARWIIPTETSEAI